MQSVQDQSAEGVSPHEEDMTDGDLGNGMALRTGSSSSSSSSSSSTTRRKLQSLSGSRGQPELQPRVGLPRQGSEGGEAAFTWTSCSGLDLSFKQECEGERSGSTWRASRETESLENLSKEELRERLQEASEEAELLRCELEATHRHLEGKNEALKILQGQAILEKATSHNKTLLQKSEERNKGLEKEVNALQWEITFNQVQFKNHEQTWSRKYERICSENKVVIDSLEERGREVQVLRTENAALSRRCLELLSMLSVKEQSVFQGTSAPCSPNREATVMELAVLGACQCPGVREACSCARSAAASRKLILTLRQELEAQRRRRDEALMVADAFRIAFEQQLRKRSDHFLCMAETDRLKTRPRKPKGGSENRLGVSVSERLRGMLPSSSEVKMSDDPKETLHRLLDLLSDKEEALAHQRKVSLMLAHSAEELERRLRQQDSHLLTEPPHLLTEPPHLLTEPPHLLTEPVAVERDGQIPLSKPPDTGLKPQEAKTVAAQAEIQCLSLGEPSSRSGAVDGGGETDS
ncbi:coiled-coil domain-containing protein 125 [Aplochiton taeniatus]